MPRGRPANVLTIAQLEALLQKGRSELNDLHKRRDKVQRELDTIDQRVSKLGGARGGRGGRGGGGGGGGGGGRAPNEESLTAWSEDVLKISGIPMKVGDIVQGVQDCGYRSSSANFRAIVNQT